MILPIYVYGSGVLRKQAAEVSLDYPDLQQLIVDMWETMHHADGVGLAAPQLGKSMRLFVVDGAAISDDRPELKDFKRVMINPKILEASKQHCSYSEGCLSLPDIHVDIERPEWIEVEYTNEHLEKKSERFAGFACRMIQHEYDHLQGILFTDKAPAIRKKMLQSKLQSIAKGKGKAAYKTVVL
ncbi:MAG: peptide deformylase [Bacteroidetes bacterium]|nr:peptide deformylase [Bacteroidota bacterium]